MGITYANRWIAKKSKLNTIQAPTSLNAAVMSSSHINLKWTFNIKNEDGFKIERSTGGRSFMEIGTAPANVNSYDDKNVESGVAYYYRVRTYEGNCFSAYSNQCFISIELNAQKKFEVESSRQSS